MVFFNTEKRTITVRPACLACFNHIRFLGKQIYWAKVLPEQWELIQIFRKHDIFKRIKNAFRTGYHSSFKITKFYSPKMSLDNLIR